MKQRISLFTRAIINSYAVLFFSQNMASGIILLLVTFFNAVAGASALACVIASLIIANALHYERDNIQTGIYSFNSLLLGLAFGTFFQLNFHYFIWLAVACLVVVIITIILSERLTRLGLPILSLPFVFTFWLVLLAANSLSNTDLLFKNSSLLQELYNGPGTLAGFNNYLPVNLPFYLSLFFRSLSAVLFQNDTLAGILISAGLLIHSRIAFSLMVIGFAAACGFNAVTHTYPGGISYYYLGANFMLASAVVGSFFLIPSWRSYLWAVITVPIVFLLINAFGNMLAIKYLPVLSLPFCVVSLSLLYFFQLRKSPGKLNLVQLQHYSPEHNLYQFLNHQERLNDLQYFNINLPFMGKWTVSQGYDGAITHKSEWGQALDFVIEDDDKNTYQYPGALPEHFYCFNKPVLACGDGVVAQVVNHIADNEIGQINTLHNWGNTVVICHLTGLYSKVSHLKQGSVKVKPGDVVKQGDIMGLCGNSGRSPEPHLHFQVQATPYIGSKTLAYPFSHYVSSAGTGEQFCSFEVPPEGTTVSMPEISTTVKKAFDLQPGYIATLSNTNGKSEVVEVYRDERDRLYLHSHQTGATAYFINNGTLFYFTSFYGSRHSLLYYFYLAAYKIIFTDNDAIIADDVYPIQLADHKIKLWAQDLVAPFYRFIKISYQSRYIPQKTGTGIAAKKFTGTRQTMEATIQIANNSLQGFNTDINGINTQVQWTTENMY